MYYKCKTTIRTKNKGGVEIEIPRGVKQGEPFSPLLFNLCLDPLLEEIEKKTKGININDGNNVPVLAFANDIILLDKDKREAQVQLNILEKYLGKLDMKISEEKKDTWFIKDPEMKLKAQHDTFKITKPK
jgi:hypothetical protein